MTSSYREDYLLRQVKALGAILARIVGLRLGGDMEEARGQLQIAYDLLFGPRSELLRGLDSGTAATLLDSSEAILALAELTNEEAAQHEDAGGSGALQVRAMELGIEAAQRDNKSAAIRAFLAELIPKVDRKQLTPEQRQFLSREFGPQAGAAGGVGAVES
jgi:hypothetical protein